MIIKIWEDDSDEEEYYPTTKVELFDLSDKRDVLDLIGSRHIEGEYYRAERMSQKEVKAIIDKSTK